MPRFSKNEKEKIQVRLFVEGERLFVTYGLRKVTIDEIVTAVKIAKATFYTFYDNKEYLYLDIVQRIQLSIFKELESLLETNADCTNQERVRQVVNKMYDLILNYPILSQNDNRADEIINRKVSKERLSSFASQNLDPVFLLRKHGIRFQCSPQIASNAFRALHHGWIGLQNEEKEVRKEVVNILLSGLIEQLIE